MKKSDLGKQSVEAAPEPSSERRQVLRSVNQRIISVVRKVEEICRGKLIRIAAVCGVLLSVCFISYIAYLSYQAIKDGRMANSCLVETRGVVQVQRNAMDDAYRGRIRFLSGDIIRTGDSGICTIKMNKTVVTVGSNSFLTVGMYENGNRTVFDAMLLSGSASVVTRKMDKMSIVRIRTDLADIKAKGTRFAVYSGLNGSTRITVTDGKVLVLRKYRDPVVLEKQRTMEINRGGMAIVWDAKAAEKVDTIYNSVPTGDTEKTVLDSVKRQYGMTFRVNADKKWQKTGLRVQKGDAIYLSATGSISITTQGGSHADISPGGRIIPELNAPPIFPGLGFGILIVRIGEDIIPVGRMRRIEAEGPGEIEFCINDNILGYYDNSGFFNVEVNIEKRQ